jgi:hypothetical protein
MAGRECEGDIVQLNSHSVAPPRLQLSGELMPFAMRQVEYAVGDPQGRAIRMNVAQARRQRRMGTVASEIHSQHRGAKYLEAIFQRWRIEH